MSTKTKPKTPDASDHLRMQEVDHDLAVPEDYLEAQKAAVEAVQIGRATVEAVARQGEQLQHADEMADDVQFKLDKSARLLRGMTWSGWIANMFSKEVQGPPASSREQKQVLYEHVPVVAQPAAQAIQNYQANLRIFQGCETMEQKETCQLVCDRMYEVASKEVSKLMHARDDSVQLLKHQFKKDLAYLRQRQITAQDKVILGKSPVPVASRSTTSNKSTTTTNNKNSKLEAPHQMHEQHLEVLSQNLGELNTMAHSLSEMMGQQNRRMESIDDKSEAIHETTKMVTRRAERLIQKKSWKSPKKEFYANVKIRHLPTGNYVAAIKGCLVLVDTVPDATCVFAMYKRPNGLFGLRNHVTDKWVGQSLLGSLGCSASSFGHCEEWEAGEDWNETRLLCVSAGWGNGGYLVVGANGAIHIGPGGVEGKQKADLWRIEEEHLVLDER